MWPIVMEQANLERARICQLARKTLAKCEMSMRLSPCVLVQPDGWARGEREGYGEPCDVTSLSLSLTSLSLTIIDIQQYPTQRATQNNGTTLT